MDVGMLVISLDETNLLDDLVMQDLSNEDEESAAGDSIANSSLPTKKTVGLIVAFCLTFRVVFNIPDRAIILLLCFFKYIFLTIGIEINIPQSLHNSMAFLGLQKEPHIEYVSCPSCHLLYDSKVLLESHRRPEMIKCTHVEFPNHPQKQFRLPCNIPLFSKYSGNKVTNILNLEKVITIMG